MIRAIASHQSNITSFVVGRTVNSLLNMMTHFARVSKLTIGMMRPPNEAENVLTQSSSRCDNKAVDQVVPGHNPKTVG